MARCPSAISWLGGLVVGVLVGCGDPEIEHLREIKDAVCSCKSSACAEQAMLRVPEKKIPSNRRTQRVAREMLDCVWKLHNEDRPDDPDTKPDGEPANVEPTASGAGAAPAAARTPPR